MFASILYIHITGRHNLIVCVYNSGRIPTLFNLMVYFDDKFHFLGKIKHFPKIILECPLHLNSDQIFVQF